MGITSLLRAPTYYDKAGHLNSTEVCVTIIDFGLVTQNDAWMHIHNTEPI